MNRFSSKLHGKLHPALQERDFALLWIAMLTGGIGGMMVVVAVGWQVASIHEGNPRVAAFDLGLVGLCEFLGLTATALPAGWLADHFPRRMVLAISTAGITVVTALLLVVTINGATQLWPFLVLSFFTGIASSLGNPSARALPPTLVPVEILPSAMALRSVAFQAAVVGGPAIGGLLFGISPELVYVVAIVMLIIAGIATLAMHERAAAATTTVSTGLSGILVGIRFIKHSPMVLGAITLDLFAVLFGGAIALAPIFAKEVLHVGPEGLGLLRAAPAAGALVAGIILTRKPLGGRAGRTLLIVVAIFGASMVVFGLSRSFPLSLAALAVSGYVDMISMNIRGTTVALATPDEFRGRVIAVESVFIGASNELGAFESGLTARLFGTVRSVVAGGILTVILAGSSAKLFPAIAKIDHLEDITPSDEAVRAAGGEPALAPL